MLAHQTLWIRTPYPSLWRGPVVSPDFITSFCGGTSLNSPDEALAGCVSTELYIVAQAHPAASLSYGEPLSRSGTTHLSRFPSLPSQVIFSILTLHLCVQLHPVATIPSQGEIKAISTPSSKVLVTN